ncbi:hypothetical protein ABW19_dt0203288 [Dactylella cylindrospora]|nr:hypothetical protein ABW19_dt0203288 [Dactylella cylindrospora]
MSSTNGATLSLEDAFRDSPLLQQQILQYVGSHPESHVLFQRIADFIVESRQREAGNLDEPSAKRRKIDNAGSQIEMVNRSDLDTAIGSLTPIVRVPDISFSIPQRKKFNLVINETAIAAVGANGAIEFGVFVKDIGGFAAFSQWNFCIFSKNSHGFNDIPVDPLLFTVNEIAPKNAAPIAGETSYKQAIINGLNRALPSIPVVEPDPETFRSLAAKSYRKDEVPFHVNAHLGTKEGFLFFLKGAIIWGFKKPLQCFLFDSIESSSYSSITQRTFSLTIKTPEDLSGREVEFSMIDHAEHPAIDQYLRENQLKDASMSEMRRAKILPSLAKENAGKKSELQAAEDEIAGIDPEDDDDEDDEDYAGSDEDDDDKSSDSGSEDSDSDGERDGSTEGNLAEEELGSELEEVEITDEEDDEGDY